MSQALPSGGGVISGDGASGAGVISGDGPSGADVLAELSALLDRQLELARDGRYEELTATTGQARRLMADLADLASREPADRRQDYRQQLDRLRRVHRLLALTLADQHRDTRNQVQKMRQGHGALRGYGRSG